MDQNYEESLAICESLVKELEGDVLLPKFELLRAQCIAKIYGYDQYEKALEDIKLNYSATKEGKNAEIIINEIGKYLRVFCSNNIIKNIESKNKTNDILLPLNIIAVK